MNFNILNKTSLAFCDFGVSFGGCREYHKFTFIHNKSKLKVKNLDRKKQNGPRENHQF